MRILITGVSGAIGGELAPALLAGGHEVRGLSREREPAALAARVPAGVSLMRGDAVSGRGLRQALRGVEVAYYLIHSMEPQPGVALRERERAAARNFAAAAMRACVRRVVYLGGMLPDGSGPGSRQRSGPGSRQRSGPGSRQPSGPGSRQPSGPGSRRPSGPGSRQPSGPGPRHSSRPGSRPTSGPDPGRSASGAAAGRATTPRAPALSAHLASRLAVERILMDALPDSVALRASIVIGARSRSFRLLVRLIERMPVLVVPAWREHRTAPVDLRDVIECLIRAAQAPAVAGRSLDLAGPEVISYGALIERIRELLMVERPTLKLPGLSLTPIASRLAALIAGEQHALIGPLMEGLNVDLLPREPSAAALLGVRTHTLGAAIEHALGQWERVEPLRAR